MDGQMDGGLRRGVGFTQRCKETGGRRFPLMGRREEIGVWGCGVHLDGSFPGGREQEVLAQALSMYKSRKSLVALSDSDPPLFPHRVAYLPG